MPELISAGVDWFTGTARSTEAVDSLRAVALGLAEVQLHDGFYGRPWRQSGYEGFAVGHVQYGERDDGCCIRLGSNVADAHWHRCFAFAENVTRLDVQSTWRFKSEVGPLIQKHYGEILRRNKRFKKAPAVSMLVDGTGGRTVYSGRRSSDCFGRIYDKGRESKSPSFDRCVRYEIELKGKRGKALSSDFFLRRVQPVAIAALTLEWFRRRGCFLRPLIEKLGAHQNVFYPECPAILADAERSLRWIEKSVFPTIERLRAYYGDERIAASLRFS